MSRAFQACEDCGGNVQRRKVTIDLRRGDRLYVFLHVPIGVCAKCGERYYPGPVLERIEEVIEHGLAKGRKISVPTFDFAEAG